ncbi:MAG: Alg9-like mannosyltransferase family-domain-containing protein, partial [Olpidium bornovanus]
MAHSIVWAGWVWVRVEPARTIFPRRPHPTLRGLGSVAPAGSPPPPPPTPTRRPAAPPAIPSPARGRVAPAAERRFPALVTRAWRTDRTRAAFAVRPVLLRRWRCGAPRTVPPNPPLALSALPFLVCNGRRRRARARLAQGTDPAHPGPFRCSRVRRPCRRQRFCERDAYDSKAPPTACNNAVLCDTADSRAGFWISFLIICCGARPPAEVTGSSLPKASLTLRAILQNTFGYLTWEWAEGIRGYAHPLLIAAGYKLLQICRLDDTELLVQNANNARVGTFALKIYVPMLTQAAVAAVGDWNVYMLAFNLFRNHRIAKFALVLQLTSWWNWFCSTRTLVNSAEACLTAVALARWPWNTSITERGDV